MAGFCIIARLLVAEAADVFTLATFIICRSASMPTAEGSGRLLDAHTVEVTLSAGGTERITARHILLAVGGRAVKAPIEGSVSDTSNWELQTARVALRNMICAVTCKYGFDTAVKAGLPDLTCDSHVVDACRGKILDERTSCVRTNLFCLQCLHLRQHKQNDYTYYKQA